ncbi:MAG: late competence development ComFB family protein [Gammaproteobacteria bacterium]|nr:late competence development ComFB family protein [Gammaproteobacteria bacterium]
MDFASVHNFHEQLVLDKLAVLSTTELSDLDEDILSDIACVALNQLPAHYVRYNVDLLFYMPISEREKMNAAVDNAVNEAIEFVRQHKNKE